jgi:hypothetical protein
MHRRVAVLALCWVAFAACSGPAMPPAPEAESLQQRSGGAEAVHAARAVPFTREEAHRTLIAAVACWFGGLWSNAEAASDEDRVAAAKARCQDFVRRLYGRNDADRVERLRGLEPAAVLELADEIVAIAETDEIDAKRYEHLVKLLNASADVARETMYARRAADKVKNDLLVGKPEDTRANDESAAVDPLTKDQSLAALLKLDVRDLTHEARAIAILHAMDRMNVARGLPKRLKVAALRGPFALLFGVPVSDADTSKPLEGGVWLAYLASVANAAGHPVPAKAESLADQERMAWGGAVVGLVDKLQTEAAMLADTTELRVVAAAIIRRLQARYEASAAMTLKASQTEPLLEDEGWP